MTRIAILLTLLTATLIRPATARTFTDDSGRKIEAELIAVREGKVVLSKNGNFAEWPIEKLSKPDQIYIKAWQLNPPAVARLSLRIWERDGVGPAGTFMQDKIKSILPSGSPLSQTEKRAKYKYYDIDLNNETELDAHTLQVAYVMFTVNAKGIVEQKPGSVAVGEIPAGKRVTVQTKGATYVSTKTTTMTLGTNSSGNLTIGDDTSRGRERFAGAWVRVYAKGGKLVGEARKLIPEIERQRPRWTGASGKWELPEKLQLDPFKTLKDLLPPPPELPPLPKLPF